MCCCLLIRVKDSLEKFRVTNKTLISIVPQPVVVPLSICHGAEQNTSHPRVLQTACLAFKKCLRFALHRALWDNFVMFFCKINLAIWPPKHRLRFSKFYKEKMVSIPTLRCLLPIVYVGRQFNSWLWIQIWCMAASKVPISTRWCCEPNGSKFCLVSDDFPQRSAISTLKPDVLSSRN